METCSLHTLSIEVYTDSFFEVCLNGFTMESCCDVLVSSYTLFYIRELIIAMFTNEGHRRASETNNFKSCVDSTKQFMH